MKKLVLLGLHEVDFDPNEDIDFLITETLPYHPNALTFLATTRNGDAIAETYYSVGGGFVVKEGEVTLSKDAAQLAFPINKIHTAHYVLLNIECESKTLNELTGSFRFSDAVLRHLVVKMDKAETEPSPMARGDEEAREAAFSDDGDDDNMSSNA